MSDVLPTLAVILLATVGAVVQARYYEKWERSLLAYSLVAHVLAALAQVVITNVVYGGGDMMMYFVHGNRVADLLRSDFGRFAPEIVKLIMQEDAFVPAHFLGHGDSTGTMTGITAFLLFFLGGSLYGSCVAVGVLCHFSNTALYRVFRENVPEYLHRRLLIATTLIPSVVYWSSALLKEAIVMTVFGWTVYCVHLVLVRKKFVAIVPIVVGAGLIALVKAYVLFPLVIASSVWLYWRRASRAAGGEAVVIKPVYLALGAALAVAGVSILGELFPRFALERFSEEAARMQFVGGIAQGGSYYQLGDATDRGLVGQLAFTPLALLTAWFRPLIIEVTNVPMVMNALETTALAFLLVQAAFKKGLLTIWSIVQGSPFLMFALTFAATLGVAVGLASTNLGTLSRYRVPLVPFFAGLVLVLSAPKVRAARDVGPRATDGLPEAA